MIVVLHDMLTDHQTDILRQLAEPKVDVIWFQYQRLLIDFNAKLFTVGHIQSSGTGRYICSQHDSH